MKQFFKEFLLEEEGQGMAEYALVLGVIAVGVVGVLTIFGEEIMDVFRNITGEFEGINEEDAG
ncbi:Flp family type IVb pilin [Alkalibacillus haloalkaliphilus]|uniref:Flp family type IVb pilin n=1 Tax=Alkalibacillus haloalkaliphilus TaxID=94136 RepID=UPI002936B5BA|nr:Flp family type IVb pilin [Alkalibacillus haloalkaliphilus]MDV2581347.1 Flp family type IVb pilin [Alkalibacillus haloalkaliphilus]